MNIKQLHKKLIIVLLSIQSLVFLIISFSIYTFFFTLFLILAIIFILYSDSKTDTSNDFVDVENHNVILEDINSESYNIEAIDNLSSILFSIFQIAGFIYISRLDQDWIVLKSSSKTATYKENLNDIINSTLIKQVINTEKISTVSYKDDPQTFSFYESILKPREDIFAYPIFSRGHMHGIIVIDTFKNDIHDENDIKTLKTIISLYSKTLNLQESHNRLSDVYCEFYKYANSLQSLNYFYELIKHIIPKIFEASNFYITHKLNNDKYSIVSSLGFIENIDINEEFNLNEGIIGWAIKNKKTVMIDQLIKNNQYTVRFKQNEKRPLTTNSLMFHPGQNIGIGLESTSISAFSEEDRKHLEELIVDSELIYKEIKKRETLHKNVLNDPNYLILSSSAFKLIFNLLRTLQVPMAMIVYEIRTNKISNKMNNEIINKYAIKHLKDNQDNSLLFILSNNQLLQLFIDETNDLSSIEKKEVTKLNSNRVLINNQYFSIHVDTSLYENIHHLTYDKLLLKIHTHTNKIT